jgi:hypothetical protein
MRIPSRAVFTVTLTAALLSAGFASAGSASTRIINFPSNFGTAQPIGLSMNDAGSFFGTAAKGGIKNVGGVFELHPPPAGSLQWTGETIYTFAGGSDGASPTSQPLVFKGTIYGTTSAGGAGCKWPGSSGCGTVFTLTPSANPGGGWTKKTIWQFSQTDGATPTGKLAVDSNGVLYGTTQYGGTGSCKNGKIVAGCGLVFKLAPPATASGKWKQTVLHRFAGGLGVSAPLGGVVADAKGNLYGTAYGAGLSACGLSAQCGTVFMLKPPAKTGGAWTESILWRFKGNKDGALPYGAPIVEANGALIGTTLGGGGMNAGICGGFRCGSVFRLNPPATANGKWTEDILYAFTGGADGAAPQTTLIQDAAGALYGTTLYGGNTGCNVSGCGVVFALRPDAEGKPWKEMTLYSFFNTTAYKPSQNLVADKAGHLIGTAQLGGTQGAGVLFEISGAGFRR